MLCIFVTFEKLILEIRTNAKVNIDWEKKILIEIYLLTYLI